MQNARDIAEKTPLATPSGLQLASAPFLSMRGITKRYDSNVALNAVDFEARSDEIHALLGENGAGKSTLMQILAGLVKADSAEISLNGSPVLIDSPGAARTLGIAMVHQHFTLVPAFTIAENLALNLPDNRSLLQRLKQGFAYSTGASAERALEMAKSLGWELSPNSRVSDLPVGTQQRVEIVKALAADANLLIFDEPTAVLAPNEVEELFTVLRRLRDQGKTVVLIAHKLAEIMAVADRVTVLRRGVTAATTKVSDTTLEQLAFWMVGASVAQESEVSSVSPKISPLPSSKALNEEKSANLSAPRSGEKEAFVASDLTVLGDRGETALRGLSLNVKSGEILGIGGVDGNGQTELAEVLVGLRKQASGKLSWKGELFSPGASPTTGYVPQDRRRSGLALSMSVQDNLLFEAVKSRDFKRGAFLNKKALERLSNDLIEEFDIRTSNSGSPVSSLSGGNQQKIVVARSFYSNPEWIVVVNPTRGLDISATRFVHSQLRKAKARGASIVLISTDLDEIAALADRTAILSGGSLTEIAPGDRDPVQLGMLLGGAGSNAESGGTSHSPKVPRSRP